MAKGFAVLPDDKSIICAEVFEVRAYNRPHLNPNSKKQAHWQILREDKLPFKIGFIKLAPWEISGSHKVKYLPLLVFADGTGWRAYNAMEVMNPTNLAEIAKPMSFNRLAVNEKYRGQDVDFLKKGTVCVIACTSKDR